MRTTSIIKRLALVTLLGSALAAPVMAQMGAGMGGGWGGGPGMMANQNVARGWQLVTPEERTAQQIKMRAVKTYDECTAVQAEHRLTIEARAKEKGVNVLSPRGNPCDNLKARGLIQ